MGASISKPQSTRLQLCNDPESSTILHSFGEPTLLNLGGRVFLSHSGMDKDFVRLLNRDLRRFYHGIEMTFFDEETLICNGKPISMGKSIVEVARESALGVLVLTDDFFMQTPNPMLELEAFVAGKVDLLPLFFLLSVKEFKEKKRWDRWEKRWKEWAAKDDKLVVGKWRTYLEGVSRYIGLEFCKITPEGRQDLYIEEVVKQVARIMGPIVPMSGADVYGKDRLCQVVDDMYKKCASKRSSLIDCPPTQIASTSANLGLWEEGGFYAYDFYAYDMVGIHGFPGLGKTTLCKCLCDFYFRQLNGKVCYIDVGLLSESRLSRLQHVLSRLDWSNTKDMHNLQLDSDQEKIVLKERLSSIKDPVFLAIDNILPEGESREEVLSYLRCKFPKGSKILIASKSEGTLTNLTKLLPHICSLSTVIEYMPALEFEEARDIFKHEFPVLHNPWGSNLPAAEENIQGDVDVCVNKCIIVELKRYHPMMLKSLAALAKSEELMPDLDWKERLAELASKEIIHNPGDEWSEVFRLFDLTYGRLDEKDKKVFLDLALCYSAISSSVFNHMELCEWIKMLHPTYKLRKGEEMETILLRLHNYCFIVKEGRTINIGDLMLEYGKHKAGADSDGYVVWEDIAHEPLPLTLPRTARHVSIARCRYALRMLDLRAVENVTLLHLVDNAGLEEVILSHFSSIHLRSMIVSVPAGTELRCIVNEDWISYHFIQCLKLRGNFNFCLQPSLVPAEWMETGSLWYLLGGFRKLEILSLESAILTASGSMQSMDLTPYDHLQRLVLKKISGLKSIRGPERSSRLGEVEIWNLPDLEEVAVTVLGNSKTHFSIGHCDRLRRVSLTPSIIAYAGLKDKKAAEPEGNLKIFHCPRLANVDGLSQYTGGLQYYIYPEDYEVQGYRFWEKTFVGMVKNAGIDLSRCKAKVTRLKLDGFNPAAHDWLGAVKILCLEDAQHIGLLISAMCQAKLTDLECLKIRCQQSGDGCGCDRNAPNFSYTLRIQDLEYCCPQVRDLGSLNDQVYSLRNLCLNGCTSVEVWPDFADMTSLEFLDLSNTSLKGWPAGVQLLPRLECLILK